MRFIFWLKSVEFKNETGRQAFHCHILHAEHLRSNLLEADKAVLALSKTNRYCENYRLIISVPGIGITVGMTLLTEMEDIARFPKSDHPAGFVGFVPTCHSSGEDERQGEITPRRHKTLREMLIESSWIAVRKDPALYKAFARYCKRMDGNKAITRIARKLVNRMFFVLKNRKAYENILV